MAAHGQRRGLVGGRRFLPLLPLLLFLSLVVGVPVGYLFATSLPEAGRLAAVGSLASDPLTREAVANSLEQGALSAGLAGALGYPVGVFLGRFDFRGREGLRAFLLVPFLLPSLVVILGFQALFGPGGILSGPLPFLGVFARGLPGILAVNVYFNAAMVALLTATATEASAAEQEEAVAVLGGTPLRVYREVWGPLSWVGAAAGMLLTFLLSALGFAAPLVVCGARCYTLEVRIWSLDQYLGEPALAGAVALGTVLLLTLPTFGYLLAQRHAQRRAARRPRSPRRVPWRDARLWPLFAGVAAFFFGILALIGAVLARAISAGGGGAAGRGWSLLFSPSLGGQLGISTLGALTNSLLFATGAAIIALLLGVSAGYARRLGESRGLGIDYLLFLPLLISPVILAFGLSAFWLPALGGAASSWFLILLSQATVALPFALQSIRLAVARIPPAAWEAAMTLGRGPWGAHLDVELPRARGGLVGAGLFAFAIGLGEFTATFFLVRPPFTTLPVELLRLGGLRLPGAADALAGLLVAVSVATFLAIELGGRRIDL